MCIVISKPVKKKLKTEFYQNAFKHNKDGAGVAYVEDKELKVKKGIFDEKEFVKFVEDRENQELLIHCRIATHGEIGLDNCHPFLITPTKQFPQFAYAIAHNGILTWRSTKKQSDTSCFIEDILEPMLTQNPWMFDQNYMDDIMGKFISERNKIVIMRYDSKADEITTYIINAKEGFKAYGCWFSNMSYQYPRYTPKENWDDDGYYKNGAYGGAWQGVGPGHQGVLPGVSQSPPPTPLQSVINKATGITDRASNNSGIEEFGDWIFLTKENKWLNKNPHYTGANKASDEQINRYYKALAERLGAASGKLIGKDGVVASEDKKSTAIVVPRDKGVVEEDDPMGHVDPIDHLDDEELKMLRYMCVKWFSHDKSYVLKGKKTEELAADMRRDIKMLLPNMKDIADPFLDLAIIRDGDTIVSDMETKMEEIKMSEAADIAADVGAVD